MRSIVLSLTALLVAMPAPAKAQGSPGRARQAANPTSNGSRDDALIANALSAAPRSVAASAFGRGKSRREVKTTEPSAK